MEDIEKAIARCHDALMAYNQESDVINEIGKVMTSVVGRNLDEFTPDQLSRLSFKLAALLYNLGQLVEHKKMSYNCAYSARKYEAANRYLTIADGTVSEKQSIVEQAITGVRERENAEGYLAGSLDRLYKDLERIVTVLQSVLSYKKTEYIMSRQGVEM